ncbi:hypothetical protein EDF81_0593 [Enterobacter sp. BIGb0383]|uniref:hypothetical protein n=1 Tax=unclassified Enterobacter TaxID=2608935 RepID=UPI000F4A0476|nr:MULTISPECIES: hypothetical protein [unclassified Enterobacter]ROP62111.1 hypothetical protein EDF81_0593 [Enterobacter sp. BIGb0383]ROS12273.1 hypothetical protein EC848_0595 [Enterobacter sp. BIGb0359]
MKTAAKLSVLGASVLLLAACDSLDPDSTKNEFWYSNPTGQTLTFKVDDKDYTLEPGKAAMLKLSPGMHKMQTAKGTQQDFMVYENNSGGIINPNSYVYYMMSEVYAVEGNAKSFRPAVYDVTINGHELSMPVRSSNAVLIDHNLFNCSYPLGEAFPTEITTSSQSKGNIKTKCFDKTELLAYLASEYGEKLEPATPADAAKDSINRIFNYEIPQPAFKDAETQKEATKLTDLLKQIQTSDDVDIHDKLNKDLHQASVDVVGAAVKMMANSTVAENEYYNKFINQTGEFRTYGVMPK